jgi:hypothetical protein
MHHAESATSTAHGVSDVVWSRVCVADLRIGDTILYPHPAFVTIPEPDHQPSGVYRVHAIAPAPRIKAIDLLLQSLDGSWWTESLPPKHSLWVIRECPAPPTAASVAQ